MSGITIVFRGAFDTRVGFSDKTTIRIVHDQAPQFSLFFPIYGYSEDYDEKVGVVPLHQRPWRQLQDTLDNQDWQNDWESNAIQDAIALSRGPKNLLQYIKKLDEEIKDKETQEKNGNVDRFVAVREIFRLGERRLFLSKYLEEYFRLLHNWQEDLEQRIDACLSWADKIYLQSDGSWPLRGEEAFENYKYLDEEGVTWCEPYTNPNYSSVSGMIYTGGGTNMRVFK